MTLIAALLFSSLVANAPAKPELIITSPTNYQVFQRASRTAGKVAFDVKVDPAPQGAAVEALLTGVPADGKPGDQWHRLAKSADEHYRTQLAVPAGGWYRVAIRVRYPDETLVESSVDHVGVGEVFVVGGQSNSTNHGAKRQQTATGLVSSFDGRQWALAIDPLPGVDGSGGSIWPLFGDALAEKYKVPIGIVPVGAGSTSVRHWLPVGERVQILPTNGGLKPVGDHEWESTGTLFNRMTSRMKFLGPDGFRAMLWHQGESDANQQNPARTLPGEKYRQYLQLIIIRSRRQAGWDVPWFVAQASYHSPQDPASPDIRAAQKSLWDDKTALQGPDTDTLTGDNRNGVHMSDKGLHGHAGLWADKIIAYLDSSLSPTR